MNWSFLQHVIGDMHNDEEYQPVRVRLPSGAVLEAVRFEKDVHGQWQLIVDVEVARKDGA